jgi:hypothetical protein
VYVVLVKASPAVTTIVAVVTPTAVDTVVDEVPFTVTVEELLLLTGTTTTEVVPLGKVTL